MSREHARATGIALAFVDGARQRRLDLRERPRREALQRRDRVHDREERGRGRAPRSCSLSRPPRPGAPAYGGLPSRRPQAWLALVAVAVDRRQRALRPLLRGARARRGDAGRVHPEDARRLGRAARRAAPRASASGSRTRSRSASSSPARPGSRARRHGRVRDRRGDDPRRDAPLVDRGRATSSAARAAPPRDARRCAHGESAPRCSSAGSPSPAGGRSSPGSAREQWRWILLTGLLLTAYVATWYAALARAQAVDVTAVLVFGAVVTALLVGRGRRHARQRRRHGARRGRLRLLVARRCAPPARPRPCDMTDTAGPLLFARYAYPPNALGLCGADTPRTLLEYGDARRVDGGLAELARTFDGAWPYLTLIAGANGIADPLDPRVVEAYWVGNELLERVRPAELARHVDDRFRGRLGRARERLVRRRCGRGRAAPLLPRLRRLPVARADADGRWSTSRCTSSTSAGRRPRSCRRSRETGWTSSRGRCSGTVQHLRLGAAGARARFAGETDGLAFVSRSAAGRPRLAALGLRLRRPLAARALRGSCVPRASPSPSSTRRAPSARLSPSGSSSRRTGEARARRRMIAP